MCSVAPVPFFARSAQVLPEEGSGQIVQICAYCPDKSARDAAALATHPGAILSHGICRDCRARVEAELRVARLIDEARKSGDVTVESHPHGGWTHGIRLGESEARVFSGWYRTRREAREALPCR